MSAPLGFEVGYAPSSRASCKKCKGAIVQRNVRIGMQFKTQHFDGYVTSWYHPKCFVAHKKSLKDFRRLNGFDKLHPETRASLLKMSGQKEWLSEDELNKLKAYSELSTAVTKWCDIAEMRNLLRGNQQNFVGGTELQSGHGCAHRILYGAYSKCPDCKGDLTFVDGEYRCVAQDEWAACMFKAKDISHHPFCVPISDASNKRMQLIAKIKALNAVSHNPCVTFDDFPPMAEGNVSALFLGKSGAFVGTHANEKRAFIACGGDFVARGHSVDVMFCSSYDYSTQHSAKGKLKDAISLNIPVLLPKYITACVDANSILPKANFLSKDKDAGEEVPPRFKANPPKVSGKLVAPDQLSAKLKNSVLKDFSDRSRFHIAVFEGRTYNIVLNLADIQNDTNSYYHIQLLESDYQKEWNVYRKYGRVGTTIGNKLESFHKTAAAAIIEFEDIYYQKTLNDFTAENFVKKKNKYLPVDIDNEEDEEDDDEDDDVEEGDTEEEEEGDYGNMQSTPLPQQMSDMNLTSRKPSQQHPPMVGGLHCLVADFIELIFDAKKMQSELISMDIDVKKMPLGKISHARIREAYAVLQSIESVLGGSEEKSGEQISESRKPAILMGLNNRFYTLIPHDFGREAVPQIDSLDHLRKKMKQLESLLNLSIASGLMNVKPKKGQSLIRARYETLQTEIHPVSIYSAEFKVISAFLRNSHSICHRHYSIRLHVMFRLSRDSERGSFRQWMERTNSNRRLLCHGSRITNFVGILSQGLKIAPPEAPKSGWMFGKGLYFGDMTSKAIEYCRANKENPECMVLLADVALGNTFEFDKATYATEAPEGYQSTLARGMYRPDDSQFVSDNTGMKVVLGQEKICNDSIEDLEMSEYIVYRTDQVRLRYLLVLRLDFDD